MKISTDKTIGHYKFGILYTRKTRLRLNGTCFRGVHNELAGNFSKWNTFEEFAYDDDFDFGDEMYKSIVSTLNESRDCKMGVVTLDFEETIGWESTDSIELYDPNNLESFNPNNRSVGLRVAKHLIDIKAPKTSLVSIVYGILNDGHNILASILTIYPGKYIGPLRDPNGGDHEDITKREGRVFFDWYHPGE